jgi:hypothetical protein
MATTWVIDFKQQNPNAPQDFVEVGHLEAEPGGLVTITVGQDGAQARWTMGPMLAADLVSGLSKALAETLATQRGSVARS